MHTPPCRSMGSTSASAFRQRNRRWQHGLARLAQLPQALLDERQIQRIGVLVVQRAVRQARIELCAFEEIIQKGLRMIGQGMHGFVENKELVIEDIDKALHEPTDRRIFVISKAMRAGIW